MSVSVLMAVYSGDKPEYLRAAIDSLFWQTLMPDQIVVVADGPLTNELYSVISSYSDICFLQLESNLGLGEALNKGLRCCDGELVIRMDADDICTKNRVQLQVDFMNSHPDVVVSSGFVQERDSEMTSLVAIKSVPLESANIDKAAKYRNPINHMAAVFRKEAVLSVGGYPPLRKAQDYALWSLLLVKGYAIGNISDVLVQARTGSEFYERRGLQYFKGEMELLSFQRRIGFLTHSQYLLSFCFRAIVRLSPKLLKIAFYRFLRGSSLVA